MNSKAAVTALALVLGLLAGFAVPSISHSEMDGSGFARPAGGQEALTPAPQARSYDPGGRRDPFKDLFGGKNIKESRTPAGPADLLVEDIQIVGVVKSKSGYKALIAMTDGFPLTARVGDRFADGYILSIGDGEVVFRKTHERGVPLLKPKDIVRDITSEER